MRDVMIYRSALHFFVKKNQHIQYGEGFAALQRDRLNMSL